MKSDVLEAQFRANMIDNWKYDYANDCYKINCYSVIYGLESRYYLLDKDKNLICVFENSYKAVNEIIKLTVDDYVRKA